MDLPVQLLILPFVPESPRYLVSNRKDEAAGRAALARLRGTEDIGEELALIVAEDRQNSSGGGEESVGIWDLFRREEYRLPIFITICMHLSQQGPNSISYRFPTMIRLRKLSNPYIRNLIREVLFIPRLMLGFPPIYMGLNPI